MFSYRVNLLGVKHREQAVKAAALYEDHWGSSMPFGEENSQPFMVDILRPWWIELFTFGLGKERIFFRVWRTRHALYVKEEQADENSENSSED